MSEEIPEIHIDHRPHHGQEQTIIEVDEIDEVVPVKIKFSIHRMRSLKDNTLQEIRRPPPEYVNIWVKLEYGDWLCPVLFDEDGHPYIMAPTKKKPVTWVKILIKGKRKKVFDVLELLEKAEDFCDYCNLPLKSENESDWLMYASGGGTIADVIECQFCEMSNIRWDEDFLKGHPVLGELETR